MNCDDYLETYRAKVRAITPEELLATAESIGFGEHANHVSATARR